jgi:malate synthase
VAHPALVPLAKEIFDSRMPTPHQIRVVRDDVSVTAQDLLQPPQGDITEQGLRTNIDVALQYLESWLGGNGCVPIYNLMEDAATAEISRAQVWQWLHHRARLHDGREINAGLYTPILEAELRRLISERRSRGIDQTCLETAGKIFDRLVHAKEFENFLTTTSYEYLT